MGYETPSKVETRTHDTFVALMWALAHPGRFGTLPVVTDNGALSAHELVGEAVMDIETSFWSSDPDIVEHLARTGARHLPPDRADFLFFPGLASEDLACVEEAKVGTMVRPDHAATLVVGCLLGEGLSLRLSGPGIRDRETVQVGGLPQAFWTLREGRRRYPSGWDVFLVDGERLLGIPRSTTVEVLATADRKARGNGGEEVR
jgi:alpha-D-ribose 1-methylphosphonate 5-triphosphate synthase subunit PhnH